MTITVKTREDDEPHEIVDRPVEPRWELNGLALHESIKDPRNLTLSHVRSGLGILLDLDWEPSVVERCAIEVEAIWDWDRSQDELKADVDYPAAQELVRDVFQRFIDEYGVTEAVRKEHDKNTADIAERAEALISELWEVGIRPTDLESKFAFPLVRALEEWMEFGPFAGRRFDDLLFSEWQPDTYGFVHFVQNALAEGYKDSPEARHHVGELLNQAVLIQAAIEADPPERVIALFAEEAEFRARYEGDVDPDDPAEPLRWADEWRRMFATSGWCPSELPDPNGWSERDIAMDRCRACGKLRGEGRVVARFLDTDEDEERLDDPCIRDLPGVFAACCGHGRSGRAVYGAGFTGPAAAERMRELGGNPPPAAFLPDPNEEAPAP